MGHFIPLFYMDVIIFPCHNPDSGLLFSVNERHSENVSIWWRHAEDTSQLAHKGEIRGVFC